MSTGRFHWQVTLTIFLGRLVAKFVKDTEVYVSLRARGGAGLSAGHARWSLLHHYQLDTRQLCLGYTPSNLSLSLSLSLSVCLCWVSCVRRLLSSLLWKHASTSSSSSLSQAGRSVRPLIISLQSSYVDITLSLARWRHCCHSPSNTAPPRHYSIARRPVGATSGTGFLLVFCSNHRCKVQRWAKIWDEQTDRQTYCSITYYPLSCISICRSQYGTLLSGSIQDF